MPSGTPPQRHERAAALEGLAASAAANIPGADFVSITLRTHDEQLRTVAATDTLATEADELQYELREGPCYAAVTRARLVLANDLASAAEFPRYAPRAVDLGIRAQAAVQLVHDGESAGLNLYARTPGTFDRSTVHIAELFATHAGVLLGYAEQVEQLSEALHTRTDIGTAIGILMERYGLDRHQAFAYLTRHSQNRNVKIRVLAQHVIDGTFRSTPAEDRDSRNWP